MRLRNRDGVVVSVDDAKATALVAAGYTVDEADGGSESVGAGSRRRRPAAASGKQD